MLEEEYLSIPLSTRELVCAVVISKVKYLSVQEVNILSVLVKVNLE